MSEYDVYNDEMSRREFSDQDVERIISGQAPDNSALTMLPPTLRALHGVAPVSLSEEGVQRLAAEAADLARSTRPQGTFTPVESSAGPRALAAALRRKFAVVAVAVFVLTGLTGVAIAANGAAPGDALYGLDRALEKVGINNGASQERIDEARALAAAGMVPEAMRHVMGVVNDGDGDEVLGSQGGESSNAAEALLKAAEEVQTGNDDAESQAVRDAVAAMLTQMSAMMDNPEFDGATFGQTVSEMARSIGGNNTDEDEDEEAESGEGSGPPDGAGPPDGVGPPDGAGPPDGDGPGRP